MLDTFQFTLVNVLLSRPCSRSLNTLCAACTDGTLCNLAGFSPKISQHTSGTRNLCCLIIERWGELRHEMICTHHCIYHVPQNAYCTNLAKPERLFSSFFNRTNHSLPFMSIWSPTLYFSLSWPTFFLTIDTIGRPPRAQEAEFKYQKPTMDTKPDSKKLLTPGPHCPSACNGRN